MTEGGMGPLDLSTADTRGFPALDAGQYNAEIFEMSMDAVKNADGQGKMPAGTPMIKVQYKITNPRIDGEEIDQDRRAFQSYTIPPKGYDKKKADILTGMIARFFIAIDFPEETVKSKTFAPDFEDCIGRSCTITLNKQRKYGTAPEDNEWENRVKNVKKAGEAAQATSGLL